MRREAYCSKASPRNDDRGGCISSQDEDYCSKEALTIFDNTTEAVVKSVSGTKGIFLSFFKGTLYRIAVYYDDSIQWSGIIEFQTAISKSLGLPNAWSSNSLTSERELSCKDFEMQISEYGRRTYSLRMDDPNVYTQMFKERAAKQEKLMREQQRKKHEFKP
jgi:hypothetical protein